ncbi:hypothetical protein CAPTEDRAFT_201190 [Capitella teleta]|uniref:Arrestin C-terminal-like domain-containing protein n=1 Tax=Capitella teleta TaxID=283909 RepID=R7T8Z7_CAPTE|nr:hypothetical protein CAPTEDRAFT_201190 [Capitella teleta]|eukprot:ELT90174.1 hypothetical protein CAPTEDRAFT_201190 [Capitella teleta]
MGQVDIFEIHFDNANGVYREGDRVSGDVKLSNSEDVAYKTLKLELRGVAVVQWNQSEVVAEQSQSVDLDDIRGDCNKEQYFLKRIILLERDESDAVLTAGDHSFAFECKLPPELPSSFEGRFGQIRYQAKACLERPNAKSKKNHVLTKKAFTVLNGLDLNFIPEAASKIDICKYKQLGNCCVSGSVTIDWAVERSGYVPGEQIWINGSVQNDSKLPVAFSRVAFYMVVDYKSKKRHRRERRKIASVDKGETLPDEVTMWNDSLPLPPLPPTGLSRCHLIDINYEIEFKALVEGGYSPVQVLKDVYIGTVPMCRKEMKSCIAGMFNQPYKASSEELRQSQVSLTQVIALSNAEQPSPSPTAPTLATLERGGCLIPSPAVGSDENKEEVKGQLRPPPFAPGHAVVSLDEPDGAVDASAPGVATMMRPWPESPLYPSFQSNELFGPVSLHEASDDQGSVHGESTYHPVYAYYPTLNRNQP